MVSDSSVTGENSSHDTSSSLEDGISLNSPEQKPSPPPPPLLLRPRQNTVSPCPFPKNKPPPKRNKIITHPTNKENVHPLRARELTVSPFPYTNVDPLRPRENTISPVPYATSAGPLPSRENKKIDDPLPARSLGRFEEEDTPAARLATAMAKRAPSRKALLPR
jgi:hypothetical protein